MRAEANSCVVSHTCPAACLSNVLPLHLLLLSISAPPALQLEIELCCLLVLLASRIVGVVSSNELVLLFLFFLFICFCSSSFREGSTCNIIAFAQAVGCQHAYGQCVPNCTEIYRPCRHSSWRSCSLPELHLMHACGMQLMTSTCMPKT